MTPAEQMRRVLDVGDVGDDMREEQAAQSGTTVNVTPSTRMHPLLAGLLGAAAGVFMFASYFANDLQSAANARERARR